MKDVFNLLREPPRIWQIPSGSAADAWLFRVSQAPDGACVDCVDRSGKPWMGGYASLHGVEREATKALQAARTQQQMRFSWGNPEDYVLLAEHEHLIPLLAETGRLVNDKLKPVMLADEAAQLQVVLTPEDGGFTARTRVAEAGEQWDNFELWTESYALVGGKQLYRIPSLGSQFAKLAHFNTHVARSHLERLLTLLYSTLDGFKLVYEGYRVVTGPPRTVEPAVVFEDVDSEGNLKLRMGLSMAGLDNEFVEGYELFRAVTVNEMERTLVVGDVIYQSVGDCMQVVDRALKKAAKASGGAYYQDDGFFFVEHPCVPPFLANTLPTLLAQYSCFGAESLTQFKIRTSRPKLRMKQVASGIDFLSADVTLEIDDQSISLAEALKYFQKQVYIPLNDGSRAVINPDYLRKLERIFRRKRGQQAQISFFDLPFLDELIEENEREHLDASGGLSKIRAALKPGKKFRAPKLSAELRPYQKTGYQWLRRLHAAGLGACLADDMGLGKTLQALAALRATIGAKTPSSLIVMPRSLLFNWQSEVARFAADLTVAVHHGPSRDLAAAARCNLVLTTYGTVRADVEILKDMRFHYIVLDESQNAKNPASQVAKAVLLLKGKHRLALSGTPVENNLTELYALFRFLNPSMFESLKAFNRDYGAPISKGDDRSAMLELRAKIAPFILRRTKREVLKELPDKVEQLLYVDMLPEQAALYESRRRFYQGLIDNEIATNGLAKSQFIVLQAFTELRQIASTPESRTEGKILSAKREMVIGELLDAIANGHKCLVFASFIGALDSLSEDLNEAGIEHVMMTGATRDREVLVRRFQNDDSIGVFLMTLKTGGVGLNLTAADYVFIYDPWWNRAAETQAVDRTHRIGQKNTVFTYKLVTRNSIEEKMLQLQQRKGELLENLVGADSASLKSFTVEDIRFALGVAP
ncbi:MAG: superfamily II DNA or RNA helicase [Rhodothermales bacterium]|jgi:superfamily II DNA or RNA helicase